MQNAYLEHLNVTVADPEATAAMLIDIFGWRERWRGPAKDGGASIHVGAEDTYVAIYTNPKMTAASETSYHVNGGLNHIGLVVEDLDAIERKVRAAGFEPHSHADYEPGRRFYFDDANGVEFEVASYA